MFLIFLYLTIYILLIYFIFKFLVVTSNYFMLVDEYFMNQIKNSNDSILVKFKNNNSNIEKSGKDLNRHLRYDFIISLFLGIIWFIIPKLLFSFSSQELLDLPPDFKYLGKTLGILTLVTTIIPIKTIKKTNVEKKIVLGTKLICAIIIIIIQLIYIYYYPRLGIGNLVSLLLLAIWSVNSIQGLTIPIKKDKENTLGSFE